MTGKLIVIEGLDGSGKATQSAKLAQHLQQTGIPLLQVSFPDYHSPSSSLINMYLEGQLGSLENVSPYAATSFYAVDRYASYKTQWEQAYLKGTTILADRYSTSNFIYQMAKLPQDQWEYYLTWTMDYEYDKLGLPRPDQVIYLDVEPEVSQRLLLERYQGDPSKRDLHEENLSYLLTCRKAAFYAWEKLGWTLISCSRNGEIYSVEEIFRRILAAL